MTAPVLGRPTQGSVAEDGAAPAEPCSVCSHLMAAHDRVARRYCEATQRNALRRNCLCRA